MKDFMLKEHKGFSYFISPLLEEYGIPHLFATRQNRLTALPGGVNFSFSDDISRETILKNYDIAGEIIGIKSDKIVKSTQTHGDRVFLVSPEHCGMGITRPTAIADADALATVHRELALCIFTADCVPILIGDKRQRICCGVHAGWQGTQKRILEKAVLLLTKGQGIPLSDLVFAIGPCIGPCCFELSASVAADLRCAIPNGDAWILQRSETSFWADLSALNRQILFDCGVLAEQISQSGLCTKCDPGLFHSFRREQEQSGRMAALIRLEEGS